MTIELAVLSTASAALDFCEKTQKPSAWEAWARTFGRLLLEARGVSMGNLDILHASEALTEDIEELFDEVSTATHQRIGFLTYVALQAAAKSHAESAYEALERQTEALNVIANASKRAEGMFGGSMSEVTRVFENITRVSLAALNTQGEG